MQIRPTIFEHLATDSKISSQLRPRPSAYRILSPFVTHITKSLPVTVRYINITLMTNVVPTLPPAIN